MVPQACCVVGERYLVGMVFDREFIRPIRTLVAGTVSRIARVSAVKRNLKEAIHEGCKIVYEI